MITAIILAAGTGERIGADVPKQFIEIQGRPILAYTIQVFEDHPEVDAIELVCHPDWMNYLHEMLEREDFSKVKWVCAGGATFLESEMAGINNLSGELSNDDMLLIHCGVSPMVSADVISDVIRVCKLHDNASPASSMTYLVSETGDGLSTTQWLDRDYVMRLNVPQALRFGYVRWLCSEAERRGLLNEVDPHMASLMLAMGERIWFSKDESTNIKITKPEDLILFEGWLLARQAHGERQRPSGAAVSRDGE